VALGRKHIPSSRLVPTSVIVRDHTIMAIGHDR